MLTMEDLDQSWFELDEKEIILERKYFNKILDLLKDNEDSVIRESEISGISFWDIVSPIQDAINYINCDWVEDDGVFDGIDFSADDDNTINLWDCVRDYLDDQIDCTQPNLDDIKIELHLLNKLKELSNGDFDARIKVLRKDS